MLCLLKQTVEAVKGLLLFLCDLRNEVGKLGVAKLVRKITANGFYLFCVAECVFNIKKLFWGHFFKTSEYY